MLRMKQTIKRTCKGNPVFMMLSNSSLYIQSTHVLKKKEAKSKTGYQETHRSPELSKYF